MELWTEVKCYMCSRVCSEAPGRGEHLETLRRIGRLVPGRFCTLGSDELRCSRCGGRVYPDETYAQAASEKASQVALTHTRWISRGANPVRP